MALAVLLLIAVSPKHSTDKDHSAQNRNFEVILSRSTSVPHPETGLLPPPLQPPGLAVLT